MFNACVYARVGRSSEEDSRGDVEEADGDPDPTLPCTEDVILKTEQVTKNIQELLRAAQEFKHDRYVHNSTFQTYSLRQPIR